MPTSALPALLDLGGLIDHPYRQAAPSQRRAALSSPDTANWRTIPSPSASSTLQRHPVRVRAAIARCARVPLLLLRWFPV